MRRFFESILSKIDVELDSSSEFTEDFDTRSAFRRSVVVCKKYYLEEIPSEKELQEDLLRMYDVYKHILSEASERMIDTYQNLWTDNLQKIEETTSRELDENEILEIDKVLPVKQNVRKRRLVVRRVKLALERENYCCEIDHTHVSFTDKSTGKPFMMTRQLIPLDIQNTLYQDINFNSLPDNLVCLCPNCHAMLDHGEDAIREEMLMKLYMKHKDALKEAGVEVSMMQLLKWNGLS